MTERRVSMYAHDVQACFGSSVYFVSVMLERYSYVIGHSKCCESDWCVVDCDSGLCVVLSRCLQDH